MEAPETPIPLPATASEIDFDAEGGDLVDVGVLAQPPCVVLDGVELLERPLQPLVGVPREPPPHGKPAFRMIGHLRARRLAEDLGEHPDIGIGW